jgi:hypothetical protein
LSIGVPGRQFCTEMPNQAQARVKVSETNTFPPSITTVSGTITGLAAASSIRVSTSTRRACGSRDADIRSATVLGDVTDLEPVQQPVSGRAPHGRQRHHAEHSRRSTRHRPA